ncbi:hypothetical protein CC2G_010245 [Coprinopsis cinerea AmutBmut pab1-1]|nr:hypothetical protein CC2G_010245 [Coprinopsis cinerea AmutBmut pab1-1]
MVSIDLAPTYSPGRMELECGESINGQENDCMDNGTVKKPEFYFSTLEYNVVSLHFVSTGAFGEFHMPAGTHPGC